jgi:hypothetical protein
MRAPIIEAGWMRAANIEAGCRRSDFSRGFQQRSWSKPEAELRAM